MKDEIDCSAFSDYSINFPMAPGAICPDSDSTNTVLTPHALMASPTRTSALQNTSHGLVTAPELLRLPGKVGASFLHFLILNCISLKLVHRSFLQNDANDQMN